MSFGRKAPRDSEGLEISLAELIHYVEERTFAGAYYCYERSLVLNSSSLFVKFYKCSALEMIILLLKSVNFPETDRARLIKKKKKLLVGFLRLETFIFIM